MSERDESGREDLEALFSSGDAPLSWDKVAADARRRRLAAATAAALRAPARPAVRTLVWAPALALAGLGLAFLWGYDPSVPDVVPSREHRPPLAAARAAPPPPVELPVPVDVVENSAFYENLALLEDWEAVKASRQEKPL